MNNLLVKLNDYGQYCWNAPTWLGSLLIIGVLWTMIWKGIAMWKASKNGSKTWFVILLLVNTVGILDIIYILISGKKQNQPQV